MGRVWLDETDWTPPHGINRPDRDPIDRRTATLMALLPALFIAGVICEGWILPALGL